MRAGPIRCEVWRGKPLQGRVLQRSLSYVRAVLLHLPIPNDARSYLPFQGQSRTGLRQVDGLELCLVTGKSLSASEAGEQSILSSLREAEQRLSVRCERNDCGSI